MHATCTCLQCHFSIFSFALGLFSFIQQAQQTLTVNTGTHMKNSQDRTTPTRPTTSPSGELTEARAMMWTHLHLLVDIGDVVRVQQSHSSLKAHHCRLHTHNMGIKSVELFTQYIFLLRTARLHNLQMPIPYSIQKTKIILVLQFIHTRAVGWEGRG